MIEIKLDDEHMKENAKAINELRAIGIPEDEIQRLYDKQLASDKKQLFCENCGITETEPAFMQKYCRYCGAKLKGGEE